ncbi:hypothetical protein COO60DRAFT_1478973 [Scenedesmus sp. NREL 46B-D3]|nr:hypothetical protein COO60DRAFT_1478973 [Scenedesmus sp. NREL 46B-D3]
MPTRLACFINALQPMWCIASTAQGTRITPLLYILRNTQQTTLETIACMRNFVLSCSNKTQLAVSHTCKLISCCCSRSAALKCLSDFHAANKATTSLQLQTLNIGLAIVLVVLTLVSALQLYAVHCKYTHILCTRCNRARAAVCCLLMTSPDRSWLNISPFTTAP